MKNLYGTGKRPSAREQGKKLTERKVHSKFIRTISIPILKVTLIDLKFFYFSICNKSCTKKCLSVYAFLILLIVLDTIA